MMDKTHKLRLADTEKVEDMPLQIEWLLSFIESIGGCHAEFVSDKTKVSELLNDEEVARQAFSDFFKCDFTIGFDLYLPDFLDAIKAEFSNLQFCGEDEE